MNKNRGKSYKARCCYIDSWSCSPGDYQRRSCSDRAHIRIDPTTLLVVDACRLDVPPYRTIIRYRYFITSSINR